MAQTTMKKIAKVFAIIACIATLGIMTSCTKSNEKLIIGNWMLLSVTNGGPNDIGSTWQFTEKGTYNATWTDGESIVGTYQIIDETTLYLSMYSYTYIFTINQLDNTTMQWTEVVDGESVSVIIFKRL